MLFLSYHSSNRNHKKVMLESSWKSCPSLTVDNILGMHGMFWRMPSFMLRKIMLTLHTFKRLILVNYGMAQININLDELTLQVIWKK